jgi:hypothetical protein
MAALSLVLGLAAAAEATEIRDYQLTVRTNSAGDGEAVLRLALKDPAPVVRIPVGFARILDIRVTVGPVGAVATAESAGTQSLLVVHLPAGLQGEVQLVVTFQAPSLVPAPAVRPGERPTLPAGTRVLKHALTNTQSDVLGHYAIRILVPSGMRAHAIREALPKLRSTEAGPRVRLAAVDQANAVTLDVTDVKQGDTASMVVELVEERRSFSWLLVGALLSAAYLFAFRDLVSRPDA